MKTSGARTTVIALVCVNGVLACGTSSSIGAGSSGSPSAAAAPAVSHDWSRDPPDLAEPAIEVRGQELSKEDSYEGKVVTFTDVFRGLDYGSCSGMDLWSCDLDGPALSKDQFPNGALVRLTGRVHWEPRPGTKYKELKLGIIYADRVRDESPYEVVDRARIDSDSASLHQKRVEYVGTYKFGFEQSMLDDQLIWVTSLHDEREAMKSCIDQNGDHHVRARGRLFTTRGSYGHLGMCKTELLADSIECVR